MELFFHFFRPKAFLRSLLCCTAQVKLGQARLSTTCYLFVQEYCSMYFWSKNKDNILSQLNVSIVIHFEDNLSNVWRHGIDSAVPTVDTYIAMSSYSLHVDSTWWRRSFPFHSIIYYSLKWMISKYPYFLLPPQEWKRSIKSTVYLDISKNTVIPCRSGSPTVAFWDRYGDLSYNYHKIYYFGSQLINKFKVMLSKVMTRV
jgi:hypothetical protein